MIDKIRVTFDGSNYAIGGLSPRLGEKTKSLFDVTLARGLSLKTVRAYAYDLAIFFRWHAQQSRPFVKLDQRALIQFLKAQRIEGRAPTTVNRRMNSIQVFYRFCYNKPVAGAVQAEKSMRFLCYDRSIGIYPVFTKRSSILRVKVPHTVIRPLEKKEVNDFFKAINSYRMKAIVMLMLFCGLRSEEVVLTTLTHLDGDFPEINSHKMIVE